MIGSLNNMRDMFVNHDLTPGYKFFISFNFKILKNILPLSKIASFIIHLFKVLQDVAHTNFFFFTA